MNKVLVYTNWITVCRVVFVYLTVLFNGSYFTDYVLESEIPEFKGRHPSQSVHYYLLSLHSSYLSTSSTELIQEFADTYEHARHDPAVSCNEDIIFTCHHDYKRGLRILLNHENC